MKRKISRVILTVVVFAIVSPNNLTAKYKKAVAYIVAGHKGCTVSRFENGVLKKYKAESCMGLYEGDRLHKPGDIRSVKFDFLPYAGTKIENKSSLIVVVNPPKKKENILDIMRGIFGIKIIEFRNIPGASKGLVDSEIIPLGNATVFADRKICFDDYLRGKTIVFKELHGGELFRKTFGKDLVLIPEKVGLERGKIYIWEILRGETLHCRSLMRVLEEKDGAVVKKALERIDLMKIRNNEKIIWKAAYLQLLSDLYPDQIDLYWLSYHILISADSEVKEDKAIDRYDVLVARCLDHFKKGITETDFALLDTPGCLLTVELKRGNEKRFVRPDSRFYKDDYFRIHFQTNFEGYAVILYEDEDKGAYDLIFPFRDIDYQYKVKPKVERYSREYEFYGGPCQEKYIIILSKNPIEEVEQLQGKSNQVKCEKNSIERLNPKQDKLLEDLMKRAEREGKELKVAFINNEVYVTTSEEDLNSIAWFRLLFKNMGEE